MAFNLEMFLVVSTAVTGAVLLFYRLRRSRRNAADERPWAVELCRSFFPVLLIVLVFRSFLFEPFRIPSGSMLPTLEIGDFIVVNKFSYGLRLPLLHRKFFEVGEPQRGDVVVFRFPKDSSQAFIKRLIGLPGDYVSYYNKRLSINGNEVEWTAFEPQEGLAARLTYAYERLDSGVHEILLHDGARARSGSWEVPAGHYFVMGDNRDNSNDSRVWGFVPEENLTGRSSLVWMHWNWEQGGIDFSRIGRRIL